MMMSKQPVTGNKGLGPGAGSLTQSGSNERPVLCWFDVTTYLKAIFHCSVPVCLFVCPSSAAGGRTGSRPDDHCGHAGVQHQKRDRKRRQSSLCHFSTQIDCLKYIFNYSFIHSFRK